MSSAIDNPILNGPYDPPTRHFQIGSHGPTGAMDNGVLLCLHHSENGVRAIRVVA